MLRMVRALIDRMGGRAERFDDDTLLVFFGLPRALGDDLDRALACAREFHRLSARLRKRGLPCEFSIGVHIGELNVLRRQGRHFRFAARGDTVKTCVRLAYAAEPATTLVSDRVAALAGDRFPFDRGPELRRKGVRGTRATFLLAGERRRPVRGSAGRWLRRGDELEALREAVASLREGRGSRIAVTGAPGTGKSRLFRELRELATRRAIRVFHGRALPFGADRPLAPFRDLVCDILAIEAEMEPSALRGRLGRLAELHLDDGDIAVIGTLFALDPGRAPGREAVDSAIVKLVRGLASDAPAIVMLEDLHWLDSFERGLFQQLLRAVEGEPVLMLASWRGAVPPEFAPELRQVSLGALSPDQAVAMAAEVVGADAIGPDLTRLVLRTAEGNPLYLEEVLKALQQSGRIYFEGPVARLRDPTVDPGLPDTLQGLIAARVDALDPVAKGALQVAAVIGMTFSPQLLAEAAGTDELMVLVGELVRAGLVVPDSRSPDTSYSFASVLVWESVSRGILGLQRKEYHRMVAAALQRLLGDRLDSAIEAFATHCHAGGRIADAVAATLQAGDQHRAAQYLERALDCYLRGLAWLEKAPRGEREPQVESMLHVSAGEVALLLGLPAAERMLQVALDVASEAGPRAMETRALLALGQLYRSRGRLVLARANLDAARSLARRLHDVASEVQTLEALGAAALDEGRHDEARQLYEEGLHVAGDDRGLAARMLLGLANHALQRDDNASARQLLAEARPLAEGAQDRILLGRIVNNLGIANLNEGRHQEALADFRRALELRRGLGYRHGEAINLHNIGDAWLRLRDPGRAWASFEQSRDVAREAGWERGVAMNDVYLGYLRGLRGEDVGLALQRAAATAQRLGDREIAITGQYFLARLASDTGGIAAARAAALEAGFDGLARWMEG
jgi:tetratricopeptide (TPR) repeat protein